MALRSLFILLSLSIALSAHASEEESKWNVRYDYGGELELRLDDEIRPPLKQQLDELTSQRPDLKELRLTLNSPGGSYYETLEMLPILDNLKRRGVKIITTVNNGDECDSMCILLFAQGHVRRAAEVSAFMFHGVAVSMLSNIPEKKSTDDLIYKLSLTPGLNQQWLKDLVDLGIFKTPGMYWMTGKELYQSQSGYVTELISRDYRAKPYDRSYPRLP